MDSYIQAISLLPYLCAEGEKLCLDISATGTGADQSAGQVAAFTAEYTSDLLAVGFSANIRTDIGSLVKPVMLLVQRDHYSFLQGNSPALTNSIIDKCWSRAAKYHEVQETVAGRIMFKEQFGDGGELLPFAPLFFCGKKELFFHPPCIRCGRMLSLCQDDELLGRFGFPHYSKSLHRFLYCPECTPVHGEPWYSREASSKENSIAKGPGQLLHDFGSIRNGFDPDTHFPCTGCALHGDCYGAGTEPVDVIKCFSFYPFYMVVTSRSSCSGHDYLAMISGASMEQLTDYWSQRGIKQFLLKNEEQLRTRSDAGFLHPVEDSRHFIEIVYLKVQFLKSVVEHFLDNALTDSFDGCHIPLNRVGVSILSGSSLPRYWGISITHLGFGMDLSDMVPYPKQSEPSHAYTVGLLWFVVLLANKRQGEAEIFQRLTALLESESGKTLPLRDFDDAFQPCQTFWSGKDQSIDISRWNGQWDKVLGTGQELLLAGYHNDSWQKTDIFETIDACLTELKGHVLTSAQAEITRTPDTEDERISGILEKVKNKWQSESTQSGVGYETTRAEFEEFSYPDTDCFEKQQSVPENDLDQTVIISPSSGSTRLPADDRGGNKVADSATFEETVVISSREELQQDRPESKEKKSADKQDMVFLQDADDLEKTVRIKGNQLISPGNSEKIPGARQSSEQDSTQPLDDDDFLTETVVLRPTKKDG